MTSGLIDHDNLEDFADPANYDREFGEIDDEGAFFLDLVQFSGGPVLDAARVMPGGFRPAENRGRERPP